MITTIDADTNQLACGSTFGIDIAEERGNSAV